LIPVEAFLREINRGSIVLHGGTGKGKTTVALATALRAAGRDPKVLMVQFIKGSWHYGELGAAKLLGDDRFRILPLCHGIVRAGAEKPDPK
jgi:cob(I)alamin adenosyltransferase